MCWICTDDHAAYVCGAYGNHASILFTDGWRPEGCGSTAYSPSAPPRGSPVVLTASRRSSAARHRAPESETALAELRACRLRHARSARCISFEFEARVRRPKIICPNISGARKGRAFPQAVETLTTVETVSRWHARLNGGTANRDRYDMGTFANRAVKFLTERGEARRGPAGAQKPYFLMVSFYEPHSPFHFPVEYRGRHTPGEFSVPAASPEDDWQVPAIFRDLTGEEKQGIAAAYYTSTEFLDKNVGLVLEALKLSGLEQETLVIYTGDHGYLLGQHGRFEKHCSYEPAIRAPLIMRLWWIKPEQRRRWSITASLGKS